MNSKYFSVSVGIVLGIFQVFVLNALWLVIEIKFKMDDISKNKSTTTFNIQQFAGHEFLQNKYESFLFNDLKLDKEVKINYANLKEAHFHISKIKVDEYFNELG